MPPYGPIAHRDLVRALQRLGWTGPHPGGKHLFMYNGIQRLTIPNPHRGDISLKLLSRILAEAGIDRATWEAL